LGKAALGKAASMAVKKPASRRAGKLFGAFSIHLGRACASRLPAVFGVLED
jgi:hypothetical protein